MAPAFSSTSHVREPLPRERPPIGPCQGREPGYETILVVEDEDMVRAMTRRTPSALVCVCEARNGLEALQIARELGDTLDLS